MIRRIKDAIRHWLLKKTATPYECCWRDRARAVEASARAASVTELRQMAVKYEAVGINLISTGSTHDGHRSLDTARSLRIAANVLEGTSAA